MKVSSRARRKQRHYGRMHKAGGLNLVSLMDIFTILVFFLMVNSSNVQVIQPSVPVSLPESVSDQGLRETVTITVTDEAVLFGGKVISSLDELRNNPSDIIPVLEQELGLQKVRLLKTEDTVDEAFPVTIMADRELPYQLLKKIMSTCVSAGYSAISLAVTQKAETQTATTGV